MNAGSTPGRDTPFFTKLEAIFVGQPSQAEIKRSMDQVLDSFGQPSSEENYKILGNVLVRMRKENPGVTEMLMLRCMLAMNGSLKPDFVAGAVLCSGYASLRRIRPRRRGGAQRTYCNRHPERVFNSSKKETHWGRRKLARDQ
jgi:hypothetical protein